MAKKKRQRISYVLPLASSPGGHRLGVNGLAYDQDRSILYTGGRDGVICAWDLDLAAQDTNSDAENSSAPKRSTTTFRKQVQAHTHWVNDVVLVKNNLGLVSASSDVTVKLWRPHGHETSSAYTIGSHSDYVKCLTSPGPQDNWVASGGLDHRICLWDLNGGGQTLEINVGKADNVVKGSIYTLQANGPMVASGGPEGAVRLWDIKSGKSITKFVGHTDNVRDILISEDGDTILSASSDQTIKAWSLTAGRCLHTLTMHNDSVWCMYSDDPHLAVFYSGDKSGLVAKTDTRRAMEIEEGVSVGVCQEHDGIAKVITAGNSIWTATSSSSVNRWKDVDTEQEVETPPSSPQMERSGSALSRRMDAESTTGSPQPLTNGVHAKPERIPHNAVLRLANTALHPGRKIGRNPNQSATNLRKASEALNADDLSLVIPIRGQPAETIEGQNGLIKHHMLNDRKRILTLDTAGEVVLWDLLKCAPIKSFGRRHLDEVVPDVNTTESVANWCSVDTKTGKITVQLEENYCFDAEVYADEIDIPEKIDFREDQRINLGRWVLRNLFGTLLDEEIRRDESYRKAMRSEGSTPSGSLRPNAPRKIAMPEGAAGTPMISPETMTTPKAGNNHILPPTTPGIAIGAITPGNAVQASEGGPLSPRAEDDGALDKSTTRQSQAPATDGSADYFSAPTPTQESESSSEHKEPATPGAVGGPSAPTSPTEEKKKSGLFGKKFQMGFPKKTTRQSTEVKPQAAPEEKSDSGSTKSSDKEEKVLHDNFLGVVQKIRQEYDEHGEARPEEPLPIGITPSLPIETPVLKPPPHTLIIIQEDNPESGGLADQYRGEISQLGVEADTLEKIAPMWLGELLLRNQIPFKDTVKVSFILHPYSEAADSPTPTLPSIASPDGNARLNANRMLRAKKILAYVAERIEAPTPAPAPAPAPPPSSTAPTATADADDTTNTPADPVQPAPTPDPSTTTSATAPEDANLKPEEYLHLYCQNQLVDMNMTLATLRVHVWRTGGDVVLYYRSNGRKKLRLPHPAAVPTREESGETTGVGK